MLGFVSVRAFEDLGQLAARELDVDDGADDLDDLSLAGAGGGGGGNRGRDAHEDEAPSYVLT